MSKNNEHQHERSLVTRRTLDIWAALLLLGFSAVVIFDSTRLGFGWREGEGPAPGYFPFYVAVILAAASLINLVRALKTTGAAAAQSFVSVPAFGRVCKVLVPTIAYVALIQYSGIYCASAILIMAFMLIIGRQGVLPTIGVGLGVPLALFFMFERWFLVPLPKGPLEAYLGVG